MAAMYETFLVVHLISLFLLAGVTFAALAAPDPERRRQYLMWSGIMATVAFVTGFGLLGIRRIGYPGWVWVKLAAWLALAVMVPLTYRRAAGQGALLAIMIGALALAVAMVIYRPF